MGYAQLVIGPAGSGKVIYLFVPFKSYQYIFMIGWILDLNVSWMMVKHKSEILFFMKFLFDNDINKYFLTKGLYWSWLVIVYLLL